jgi:hypothetical protein
MAHRSEIRQNYFSARYSTVIPLQAGIYRIRVRADDGVRVYVNGGLVINEWHAATGQVYQYGFFASAGNHTFVIDYFEAAGLASLYYVFQRLS